ncbi:MAG TPA: NAD-dependent epimerase/dehydratase family protein [Marinobacter sp.]|uniref:UDP-2-acetamido-2,6-beta-L-arabino-hexul-4-ose reductase n=1 Tax=Marinobacter sp. TaxID=50741 RepID=UPI002D803021|nr:NAD-dependent epimerase/dehydratase family protein [Marinobacter sp.]HET8800795.1 NAD-dependent epimerase/dehydratase family protein [Marinobacter sp.]
MRVLITGANGFIGRNLRQHLAERPDVEELAITRESSDDDLARAVSQAEFVFHLAGVNRPEDPEEFQRGNAGLTARLCEQIAARARDEGRTIPVVFSSSIQATRDNPYGKSKRDAEDEVFALSKEWAVPVHVFRLPNVFGKWSRPNYNSVVATFCHNVAQGLPLQVNDASAPLTLVYVDDVVRRFLQLLDGASANPSPEGFDQVQPEYTTTVGALAQTIRGFRESRQSLITDRVGAGLTRALHSTYLSFLRPEQFSYTVPQHGDARGVFVEMLKTPDCGQFSYFTAHPGVTRGGHYHHSKTEKFLVIKGTARFKFRHMQTGEAHELVTHGEQAEIVETVPGWTHDITNIGDDELVCMLWANEIFDRENPDTYACPL